MWLPLKRYLSYKAVILWLICQNYAGAFRMNPDSTFLVWCDWNILYKKINNWFGCFVTPHLVL